MTNKLNLSFHHGGVCVPDLEEAIAWYQHVLGYCVEARFEIPPANAKVAMMVNGELRFEIFEVTNSNPVPEERKHPQTDLKTQGNKHVAFRIPDLEAFLQIMAEKQADVALIVREAFGKSCFIRDCAGNLIEFVEE